MRKGLACDRVLLGGGLQLPVAQLLSVCWALGAKAKVRRGDRTLGRVDALAKSDATVLCFCALVDVVRAQRHIHEHVGAAVRAAIAHATDGILFVAHLRWWSERTTEVYKQD